MRRDVGVPGRKDGSAGEKGPQKKDEVPGRRDGGPEKSKERGTRGK